MSQNPEQTSTKDARGRETVTLTAYRSLSTFPLSVRAKVVNSNKRRLACALTSIFLLYACSSPEFGPGNPDYPALNPNAGKAIPITGRAPADWVVTMVAIFQPAPDRINDPVTGVADCARSGGPGANLGYRVEVNLPLVRTGPTFVSSVSVDRFEAGRCGWHFTGLDAHIQRSNGTPFSYGGVSLGLSDPGPSTEPVHPAEPYQIDLWCYDVASMGGLDCSLATWNESTPLQYIPAQKRGNLQIRAFAPSTPGISVDIHDLETEAKAYHTG